MKKLAISLLCLSLVLSFAGCAASEAVSSSSSVSSQASESVSGPGGPAGGSSGVVTAPSLPESGVGPGGNSISTGPNAGPGDGQPAGAAAGGERPGGAGTTGQNSRPPAVSEGVVPSPPTAGSGQAATQPYDIDWNKLNGDWQKEMAGVSGVSGAEAQASGPMVTLLVVVKDNFDKGKLDGMKTDMLTRYNALARGQDSSIKAASGSNYGGLYDQYAVTVGITTQKDKDNPDNWLLREMVGGGTR